MNPMASYNQSYQRYNPADEFRTPSFQEYTQAGTGVNQQQVISPQSSYAQTLNNINNINNPNVAFSGNQGMDTLSFQGSVDQSALAESVKQDKSNDGKFSFGQCLKNFGKGVVNFFGDAVKAIKEHPVKALLAAGAVVAVVATGPIGAAIVAGVGLSLGAWNLGTGIVKVAGKLASGDKDGAEKAFEDIGKGATETALSLVGFGSAMKGVNAAAKGANATKVLGASKYVKAGGFKAIKTDITKAFKVGFDADWKAITINPIKQPFKFINKFKNPDRAVKLGMYTKYKLAGQLKKANPKMSFLERYKMAGENNLLKTKIKARRQAEHLKFDPSVDGVKNGFNNFKNQFRADLEADLGYKMANSLRKSNRARAAKGKEVYWSDAELEAFKNFKFKNPMNALKEMEEAARTENFRNAATGLSVKLSEMG